MNITQNIFLNSYKEIDLLEKMLDIVVISTKTNSTS